MELSNNSGLLQIIADDGSIQNFTRSQINDIKANTLSDQQNILNGTSQTDPKLNVQALIDLATIENFCDNNDII